jgi:hypothetical protein
VTRPEIAYLAVTEPFRKKGEWVFLGCYIGDSDDGGGFDYGCCTYLEAYLMRQIIIERFAARGVLVESFAGDVEHFQPS